MDPPTGSRDALLDDPRFWCLLYESWLKPCVGDCFREGEDYFFSVRESAVEDLFRDLEQVAVASARACSLPTTYQQSDRHSVPVVSVLVSLANGWRAGVDLGMCPGDFAFDYIIVPPTGEHLVIGVHNGNSWLPALRWEEVLFLGDAAEPTATVSQARAILLFYPACFPGPTHRVEARGVLRRAWEEVGFPIRHLDEWIDRTTDRCHVDDAWRRDPTHGWVWEDGHSLRNPGFVGKHHLVRAELFPTVARLFTFL